VNGVSQGMRKALHEENSGMLSVRSSLSDYDNYYGKDFGVGAESVNLE
jgi:hypothetical protein